MIKNTICTLIIFIILSCIPYYSQFIYNSYYWILAYEIRGGLTFFTTMFVPIFSVIIFIAIRKSDSY